MIKGEWWWLFLADLVAGAGASQARGMPTAGDPLCGPGETEHTAALTDGNGQYT